MTWKLAAAKAVGQRAIATFRLSDTTESRRQWDHAFLAELSVPIGGSEVSLALAVTNTDAARFDFTAAFHTYLAVAGITDTTVKGLAGLRYRDAAAGGIEVRGDSQRVLEVFFARESCGWCTPCREGLPWIVKILDAIELGQGELEDIEVLEEHCRLLGPGNTFCALAPGAVEPLHECFEILPGGLRAAHTGEEMPVEMRSRS